MEPDITAKLADEMPRMALARRNNPKGCVHHSDYSAQYASLPPSKTMSKHGVRPSIGSISSPWGNAAMGSLTAIVKPECPHARDVFEIHRGRPQPREDSLDAELNEPSQARGGQLARKRRLLRGGIDVAMESGG